MAAPAAVAVEGISRKRPFRRQQQKKWGPNPKRLKAALPQQQSGNEGRVSVETAAGSSETPTEDLLETPPQVSPAVGDGTRNVKETQGDSKDDQIFSRYKFSDFEMGNDDGDGEKSMRVLDPRIVRQLIYCKWERATHVQCAAIQALSDGTRDGLIKSLTGSGKTLAYLIPLLNRLFTLEKKLRDKQGDKAGGFVIPRSSGTRILVVAPTRELAQQTSMASRKLCQAFPWIVIGELIGGAKKKSEKSSLRRGVTLLVGTPGRLLDHLETTTSFFAGQLMGLVLDEADRLLDAGFGSRLKTLITKLRSMTKNQPLSLVDGESKAMMKAATKFFSMGENGNLRRKSELETSSSFQSILVSATLGPDVLDLANLVLSKDAVWIDTHGMRVSTRIEKEDSVAEISKTLDQRVIVIDDFRSKLMCLLSLLLGCQARNMKALVFVSNCDMSNYLHALLQSLRWPALTDGDAKRKGDIQKGIEWEKNRRNYNRLSKKLGIEDSQSEEESENDDEDDDDKLQLQLYFSRQLLFDKIKAYKLHGNIPREDRTGNLGDYITLKSGILITTDVAARGLNLSNVDLVIQYDAPVEIEQYVQRIGRTARLGAKGRSALFLHRHEMEYLNWLKDEMCASVSLTVVNEQSVLTPLKPSRFNSGKSLSYLPPEFQNANIRDFPHFLRSRFSTFVNCQPQLAEMARRAFQSSLRSYRAFGRKQLQSVFDSKVVHWGRFAASLLISRTPRELATETSSTLKKKTSHHQIDKRGLKSRLERKRHH